MTSPIDKFRAYLKLVRIHSIIASALAPVLGACGALVVLENGYIMDLKHLGTFFLLGFIGISVHIYGQILNDYMDYNVDKQNPELSDKPLVSGKVTKKQAQFGMLVSLVLVFVFAIPFYNLLNAVVLVLMVVSATAYDLTSKKFLHSAIFLAAWAFFLGLFGGLAIGGYTNILDVPILVFVVSLLGAFQMWMNTAVLGHLKDIQNDTECGLVTFPAYLGVKVEGKVKEPDLIIPFHFKIIVLTIQIINLELAFLPIYFVSEFYVGNISITILILLILGLLILSLFIIYAQIKVLWSKKFIRKKLMKVMAIREVCAYFLVIVIVGPMIGPILVVIFILLPFVWFMISNFIFSGSLMQPDI